MRRADLIASLEQAEQHSRQAAERIQQQRELIARLEAQGRDTTMAKSVLDLFEQSYALHEVILMRLRQQLERDDSTG